MQPNFDPYNQSQPYSYEEAGFNPFMERSPRTYYANPRIEAQASPFIESVVDNSIIYDPFTDTQSQNLNATNQTTSGDALSGGTLTSDNGNLSIDLSQGAITYTDGLTQLLNIGGASNNVQVQNAAGNTILNS